MIHQFTTSKGLKVIGVESHKSPVVSVQIWTRNGSADETAGDEGLSHFIEHLVFKGTDKYKAGEIAARVESCGGEINAYTSFDQTVYYITISQEFYHEALSIIADMISTPTFDPDEVDREREVVIEEIKRSHDSLGRRASRNLFANFYEGHPYAVPVIGYEKNIRDVSVQRLKEFFAERYVAKNMFLVVTGQFDAQKLPEQVEKSFAFVKTNLPQKPQRKNVIPLNQKKCFVEEASFEEAVFYIAWPGIKIDHPDLAALECLLLILGQGASSRLYRTLRLEKNLVNSIGAGLWAPTQNEGFLSVSGSLNVDKFEAVLEEVRIQIEKLLSDGVTAEELHKAKTNFFAEEAYSLETVGGLARKYGGNFEATGDVYYHQTFHQLLKRVDEEQILAVARKYLQSQKMLMTAMVPRDKEKIQKYFEKWQLASPRTVAGAIKNGEVVEEKLKSGIKIFTRASKEAPIYNLRWAILGGSRFVPDEKAGLAELVGRVWSTQTKVKTEQEIREKTDALASSLYAFSGRNTFGMVVDGLSEHQADMAELFIEVVQNFSIQPQIIEREKAAMLETLKSRKDSPSTIASLWFHKMMFANHPYAQDPIGTPETLAKVTVKDVQTYIEKNKNNVQSVVALSGDFDKSMWQKALNKINVEVSKNKETIHFPLQALQQDQFHYEKLEKEQTHVIYGVRGLSLDSPERYTLQVLEAVLSGQGGRLFIELRDKASLAYSVSPLKMEGLGAGYFATYIGCSPEKVDTAIEMMKQELHKMAEQKISPTELQRAQNYLIGGHDIGLQKNSSLSSSIAFNEVYGISYKELFEYGGRVRAVTADHVQSLAQKLFSQKTVLSVVGPREPTGLKKSF
ncbi:insulinase family protein [bacterium]|nr:insulinase family protein [bacterium]